MLDWKKARLVNLTTKIGSGATPRGGKNAYKESGISLFRSLNVYDGQFKTKNLAYIDEGQADKLANVIVEEGDVLLNITGASIARCCVAPSELLPARVNQHVTIIRGKKDTVDPDFLAHLLASKQYKETLLHNGEKGGATRQALTKAQLQDFEIAFPPLPEQKRIVAILDKAFAGIDAVVAHTEKNLASASELFESYLNGVFTQKGDGWVETSLGKEIDLLTGFAFKSKQYTEAPDGIKLLRGDNIVQGAFRWENVKRWPKSDADAYTKFSLVEHDIILAMDRTWVKAGLKYAVISQADLPCLLLQRVACLRTKEAFNNVFLKHLIGSSKFVRYVLSIQTGLGVPHISGKQINDFTFWKPTVAEQEAIAAKADEILMQTQRLKSIYQQKLTALAELKQSILQKAFAGELTTTPEKTVEEVVA